VIAGTGVAGRKWADLLLVGITLGKYYREIQTGARVTAVYGDWHNRGNIVMPALKYRKKDVFTKGLDLTINANYNLGTTQNIDTAHVRYNWLGDFIRYRGKGGEQWYSHYRYRDNAANASMTAKYHTKERHFFAFNNVYSHFNRKGNNIVSPGSKEDAVPKKTDRNIMGISYQYKTQDKWDATLLVKYLYQRSSTILMETDIFNPSDTVFNPVKSDRHQLGVGFTASYYCSPDFRLKLSYERTNRLPESEDIYGDVMNREGNWELKPESSNNINLGVNYHLRHGDSRFYMSATGICYYAEDFIYYTFNSYTNKLKAENLLKVSNTGAEAELKYSYRQRFAAGLNVTYQNIRDREKYRTDMPDAHVLSNTYTLRIPNIPYLFANADASCLLPDIFYKGDRLSVSYSFLYVHSFYLYWSNEGAKDTKRVIPTQMAHDVNIVYALKDGRYNIALECRNITDSKLYDNFSLQKPGRSFNVKLRYFIHNN
jgi:outer membrane receptor protein involved in Fe transport